jgi:hypothetical protein
VNKGQSNKVVQTGRMVYGKHMSEPGAWFLRWSDKERNHLSSTRRDMKKQIDYLNGIYGGDMGI